MNSNIYENDDVHQHFQHFKIQQPSLHKEEYKNINDMTTTNWDRTPIRRNNFVSGPQSAFARLFPDKYRQQEELLNTQRSKSSDNRHLNINHRITIQHSETDDDVDDDENYTVRKSRRVRFYPNDDDDDDCCLKNRTKSEPHLNQIHLNNDINYDPNPEIIYRDNPDDVTYTQRVGVRYLKPPTPPPPGPILIREMQSSPPAALPPLVVSTTPPIPPRTPSPLIVREEPPTPPEYQPAKVITKTLPPPPTPPRRVIIKRMPPLPAKPRPVIIEKWLPYKKAAERPVLYQRAQKIEQTRPLQRNLILQYEPPRVQIKQELQNFGCYRVDPDIYRNQHGSSLRRTESIRRVLKDIGCDVDLITSTGYNSCYSSLANQTKNCSHYDYPRQTTTCFTDEQLDALIGSAVPTTTKTESHYDTPRIYDDDEDFDVKVESNV